ncbi:MAG: CapA family protein [Acutalibacteraceae bacterium]
MSKQRVSFWDNLKGILIILVVVGHFLYGYCDTGLSKYIVNTIYMFHMPAFVFVSGYFAKRDSTRSKLSVCKLAVAYVIFNTVMLLFNLVQSGLSNVSLLYPYNSMWYILSLIVWRFIAKPLSKVRNILPICIIAALLVGYWAEFDNLLSISRTVAFLPFFMAGYRLSTEKATSIINGRKIKEYLMGAFVLIVSIVASISMIYDYDMPTDVYLMTGYTSGAEILYRMMIFAVAAMYIVGLIYIVPDRKIPLLTVCGTNSLAIYLLHRPITFIFNWVFTSENYTELYVVYAAVASVITLFMLGNVKVSLWLDKLLKKLTGILCNEHTDEKEISIKSKLIQRMAVLFAILLFIQPIVWLADFVNSQDTSDGNYGEMFPIMTKQQSDSIKNSVSLAFIGDMILLQDQVIYGLDGKTGEYNFDDVFEYAKSYLTDADYAIGVFEGPAAGADAGYSTSNFDDHIPLYLNYPDSFAQAVKNSGIDLVTTANNHVLDKGREGALRTLDVLDSIGLEHVGSYRNEEEKNTVKVIKIKDITCAVLAYTYGSNYHTDDYFMEEDTTLTSLICSPDSEYFDECKRNVYADFERAKQTNADLIIVLPHMGTQFEHTTDDFQNTWNGIFAEAGADIILGDHSHAVQPVEYMTTNGHTTAIVNCPGNFANIYCEYDGDATALVKVYIDKDSKEVNAISVVPMYTQSQNSGQYRALPIYKIMYDEDLYKSISRYEMGRIEQVHSIIVSSMLGKEIPLESIEKEYFMFKSGYARSQVQPLEITDDEKQSVLYKALSESDSVCFVGDSVTEGTANGGYGWYEPLVALFPDLSVYNCSKGGATVQTILDRIDDVTSCKADLYVIAIGTNDVRYRDSVDESNESDFINSIKSLTDNIRKANNDAKIVFISPWCALDSDPVIRITTEERDKLLDSYGASLRQYAEKNGYIYIDASSKIKQIISSSPFDMYLVDHIHPNVIRGIALYSKAVLSD